jgi:hypothetical protein
LIMGSDGGGRLGNAGGTLSALIAQKGTYRRSGVQRARWTRELGCFRLTVDLDVARAGAGSMR